MAPPLYHLVEESRWQDFVSRGEAYVPATYKQDGFTHLTQDPNKLLVVANHFYKNVKGTYLCLELDPTLIPDKASHLTVFDTHSQRSCAGDLRGSSAGGNHKPQH